MAPMLFRGLKGSISCASPASLATCSTVDYRRPAAPGNRHGRRSYERPSAPAPAPHLKEAHRSKSLNATSLFGPSKPASKTHGKLRKPPPPPPPPPPALVSPGSSTRYLLTGGGDGDGDDNYSFFDSLEGYLESDPAPSLVPVIDPSRFRTAPEKGDEFSRPFSTPAPRPSVWPRPREERRVAFRSFSASSSSTSSSNSDITIAGTSVLGRNGGGSGPEGTWVRFQTVNTGEESAVLQPSSFRKSSASMREEVVVFRGGPAGGEPPAGLRGDSDPVVGKQLAAFPGDCRNALSSASVVSLETLHVDKADEAGVPAASKLSDLDRIPDQVVVLRVSLHCKGCEAKVRKHLSKMQGVKSFSIEFAAKKVTVVGDVTPLSVLSSISKVKNAQFWTPPLPATI